MQQWQDVDLKQLFLVAEKGGFECILSLYPLPRP
jgi:hypothetical protein